MLLVIEIWLTIRAWRAGWKGWALLPVGCSMAIGLFLGLNAADTEGIFMLGLVGDIVACIALGVMGAAKRTDSSAEHAEGEGIAAEQVH